MHVGDSDVSADQRLDAKHCMPTVNGAWGLNYLSN